MWLELNEGDVKIQFHTRQCTDKSVCHDLLLQRDQCIQSFLADFISDVAVGSQLTFLILVCGFVKFQEKISRPFQQNFMITAQGDKWKIVSDCFRLQEPVAYVAFNLNFEMICFPYTISTGSC